jgi:dihydroneopterin aldolase
MSAQVVDVSVADPVEQLVLDRWPEVRKIFFRNLHVDVHMGIHEHEKGRTQPVRINLVLYMRTDTAPATDSISEVFNYDRVRTGILDLIDGRHINLQETLVEEIARLCLDFAEVVAVRVSTEKTDIYPDTDGVGYELVRIRND